MSPDVGAAFLEGFGFGTGCGFVLTLLLIYVIFREPRNKSTLPRGGGHGAA